MRSHVFPLQENSFALLSMASCCLLIAYSLLFPALAAPAVPSPADTPFSGMRTYLGRVGPRQGQALTSTYPRSTPTAESCLCKQSALQDRHPRQEANYHPKRQASAGLSGSSGQRQQTVPSQATVHTAVTPVLRPQHLLLLAQWRRPGPEHIIDQRRIHISVDTRPL